jgi:hypothetical protein
VGSKSERLQPHPLTQCTVGLGVEKMIRFFGYFTSFVLLTAMVTVPQAAEAKTTCSTAQNAVTSDALSRGDIALAAQASGMCSNPCKSILTFYQKARLNTQNSSMVLAAYKTCTSSNSNSNSNSGGGGAGGNVRCEDDFGKIKPLVMPKIKGTPRVGNTLTYFPGKFSSCATVDTGGDFGLNWYACYDFQRINKSRYVRTGKISMQSVSCDYDFDDKRVQKSSIKLTKKHKGRYMQMCVSLKNDGYWGTFCTKTTTKVK